MALFGDPIAEAKFYRIRIIDGLGRCYLITPRHRRMNIGEQSPLMQYQNKYWAKHLLQSHSTRWGYPFDLPMLYHRLCYKPLQHHIPKQGMIEELSDRMTQGELLVYLVDNFIPPPPQGSRTHIPASSPAPQTQAMMATPPERKTKSLPQVGRQVSAPQEKRVEVPSFDLAEAIANPASQGITPVNIDPASMLAEGVIDTAQAAKDFISNPSLEGLGMMAVTAIPGKWADKVLENTNRSNIIPVSVVRYDDYFESELNGKGYRKSYIKGDYLSPANPSGEITIQQHIRGSEPAKSNSQYTSTTAISDGVEAKYYGKERIVIDTEKLQVDIDIGKVHDVEIVTPERVQSELKKEITKAQERYNAHSSPKNLDKLMRATVYLEHAIRDNECLIKGCIHKKYIKKVAE
ncbi:hypothetical protein L4C36_19215 [Photobacterium japonica]|uniref:hypothetical protein n=1 Tax=Photobacterium japonica TaxID=2910235 RepID=UPI003D0BA362